MHAGQSPKVTKVSKRYTRECFMYIGIGTIVVIVIVVLVVLALRR